MHEQTGSALELAVRALRALGHPAYATERAVRHWRRYDEETVHLLRPAQNDFDTYASIVRQRRTQLIQLFEKDRTEFGAPPDSGWDAVRATEDESATAPSG